MMPLKLLNLAMSLAVADTGAGSNYTMKGRALIVSRTTWQLSMLLSTVSLLQ